MNENPKEEENKMQQENINKIIDININQPQIEPDPLQNPFGEPSVLLEIIKTRGSKLKRDYNFAMNYSQYLVTIIRQMITLLNERTGNSIQENKHFIQFFKEITNSYLEFSNLMAKTSLLFKKNNFTAPKIFEDNISQIAEKTQVLLTSHFLNFSTTLKNKILAKGPFAKIDQITNDITTLQKEINKRIGKIEYRRKKLQKLYTANYEQLLKTIEDAKESAAFLNSMEETPDFILVELDFRAYIFKMYSKTSKFLIDCKDSIKKINALMVEFIKLVMEAVLIYLEENKKIYSQFLMQSFQEVETYYHQITKDQTDSTFLTNKVYNNEKEQIDINVLLTKYQATFLDGNQISNAKISENDNFKILLYKTIEAFLDFLIDLNPTPDAINYDNLLISMLEVRRYAGLFGGWKNSLMLASKQKHLLVFDEKISKTCVNIFEIGKLSFKSKPEKNNLYQLEIVVNKKGKTMNISTGSYFFDAKNGKTYDYLANLFTSINKINNPEKREGEKDDNALKGSKTI